jgi:membrane protease YdiL (CAAX protease family)
MIVFIGSVEGIIFGPILQTRLIKVFGIRYGILLTGTIFGIMHSTYGIVNEILFATMFGIILGYIFQKTRSIPFTVSIIGIANIMLFGILPLLKWSI